LTIKKFYIIIYLEKEKKRRKKVRYSDLKLKTNIKTESFSFNGFSIEVKQYLPVSDKYDLLMIALQKAKKSDGTYDEFLLSIYFYLNLVYLYSNIEFTAEDKADELTLYDTLKSNGLLEEIVSYIPEKEYVNLFSTLNKIVQNDMEYGTRAGAVITKVVQDLPKNAEAAAKIVENFDPKQYQSVIDFANAANGNRNIFTNKPIEKESNEDE
jgi:hypothetical protein